MSDMDDPVLPSPLDKIKERDRLTLELTEGSTLFCQNDATVGFFYLVSGAIVLQRSTDAGHCIVLHRAREGETFAEASLFSDVYHCTATVSQDSRIIQCGSRALWKLFDTDPDFAKLMAARFAVQIQASRRRVELLSIRSANARIMAALHDGLLRDDISEFADAIGLAHETVYRTLSQLAKDGQICKTARGVYKPV